MKDKKYIEEVKKIISEVKSMYAINNGTINVNDSLDNDIVFNINDQLILKTLLMTIRGNTIKLLVIGENQNKLSNGDAEKLEGEIKLNELLLDALKI